MVAIAVDAEGAEGLWGIISEKTGVALVPIRRRVVYEE